MGSSKFFAPTFVSRYRRIWIQIQIQGGGAGRDGQRSIWRQEATAISAPLSFLSYIYMIYYIYISKEKRNNLPFFARGEENNLTAPTPPYPPCVFVFVFVYKYKKGERNSE